MLACQVRHPHRDSGSLQSGRAEGGARHPHFAGSVSPGDGRGPAAGLAQPALTLTPLSLTLEQGRDRRAQGPATSAAWPVGGGLGCGGTGLSRTRHDVAAALPPIKLELCPTCGGWSPLNHHPGSAPLSPAHRQNHHPGVCRAKPRPRLVTGWGPAAEPPPPGLRAGTRAVDVRRWLRLCVHVLPRLKPGPSRATGQSRHCPPHPSQHAAPWGPGMRGTQAAEPPPWSVQS